MTNEYKQYNKFLKEKTFTLNQKKEYSIFSNYFKKNYFRYLPLNKKSNILDVGCGLGHFLYFLRKEGYTQIKGIDMDNENVSRCKKEGFNVVRGDLLKYLEDSKEKFDVIIMNDVIEHIPKKKIIYLLTLIKTRLNKEGKLFVKTLNCNSRAGLTGFFSDFTHQIGFTEKSLYQLSILTGFSHFKSANLYVYPCIPLIDQIVFLFFSAVYKVKPLSNYIQGQKPFKVFSKNILAIFQK